MTVPHRSQHNTQTYACEGKQVFTSFREGEKAIKRIRKLDNKDAQLALYRCPYCPHWHIGGKRRGDKSK